MSLYSIALSGLNAGQIALQTTGNNIANVNTPGYNREITKLAESSVMGGVTVSGVERQFNQFVASQLNQSQSATAALTSYQNQIQQIDSLLADSDSGLPVMMQNFFSSLQDLSGSASDPAARQGVIGTADNLTAQFRSLNSYFSEMQSSVNGEINDQVNQINNISSNIAKLNKEISFARAKTGEVPNGLLNQRDQLVSDLSQRIDVRVNVQDNGVYNISAGSGLSLVSGTNSFKMQAVTSFEDPTRTTLAYEDGAGNLIPVRETSIKGGSLGGVMQFRREALDEAESRLGQLAVTMAGSFNEQHMAGVDLNGDPGQAFFKVDNPRSFSNQLNTSTASLEASFTDTGQLSTSNFEITFTAATGYSVVDSKTRQQVATFPSTETTLSFGGMSVDVVGAPAEGDKFLVKPFHTAAQSFTNVIQDVSKIAAGQPGGGTGSGDNRNAQALYSLQFKPVIEGTSSLNKGYSGMVSDVANRSQIVSVNQTAQSSLTAQLRGVQQAESGVNLDEEAANLLRYQQYYQASARVIETATTMMDTILGIKR